jgi:hypothetical protein
LRCVNVTNNVFDKIPGDQPWSRGIPNTDIDGRWITHVSGRTSGTVDVTIEHNTAFNAGPVIVAVHNGPPVESVGFVFRNNLAHATGGGVEANSGGDVPTIFNGFFGGMAPPTGITFSYNDLVGASPAEQARHGMCGSGDFLCWFTPGDDQVGFRAPQRGIYQVIQNSGVPPLGSPDYRRCSHGIHDIGAWDWTALAAARRDAHPEP